MQRKTVQKPVHVTSVSGNMSGVHTCLIMSSATIGMREYSKRDMRQQYNRSMQEQLHACFTTFKPDFDLTHEVKVDKAASAHVDALYIDRERDAACRLACAADRQR